MSQNRRIIYPCHAIGLAPMSTTGYVAVHGVQSAGVTTNYTLEPVLELGQLNIYELKETIPEVEVTSSKVLDGYPLLYHLSTQGVVDGSFIGRSNAQVMFATSVFGDTQSASSGTPTSEISCSGLFWSNSSFAFSTDGPFQETISWIGNNKVAKSSSFDFLPQFTNNDAPLSLAGSGGVQIRKDMIFQPILNGVGYAGGLETTTGLDTNGQLKAFLTILPPEVTGISASGTNDISPTTGDFGCHIQSINVSVAAGREAVLELGKKYPYFRFVNFPTAVTCEISIIGTQADVFNASEAGFDGQGNNTPYRTIKLRAREGLWIDLGTANKCTSVSMAGGDAGGGNVSLTYSYTNYNQYLISHPADPSVLNGNLVWPY